MITVKFLQSIASPDFSYRPGEIVMIDKTQATPWILSGVCEIYVPDAKALEVKVKASKKE